MHSLPHRRIGPCSHGMTNCPAATSWARSSNVSLPSRLVTSSKTTSTRTTDIGTTGSRTAQTISTGTTRRSPRAGPTKKLANMTERKPHLRTVREVTPTLEFRTVHGYRRAFRVAGSGPAILLIHGIGDNSTTWQTVQTALAQRFTVIAPDLLGHGR